MITNPNAKRILVFSDSLSWGYIPGTKHERYPSNVRWPGVLQGILGNEFEVIEESLNSRGILTGDDRPGKEGRVAIDYILPCLDSHDPIDYIFVLLGTNELKYEKSNSAIDVAEQMKHLLLTIQSKPSQFREIQPKIFLLSPLVVNENTEYASTNDKYKDATEKSKQLIVEYENLSNELNIDYIDISQKAIVGVDGAHPTEESHLEIAKLVAKRII